MPYAEKLAQAAGATLVLLRVIPPGRTTDLHREAEWDAIDEARSYLQDQVALSLAADVDSEIDVRFGEPVATILDTAREHEAHLIVMSSHGRGGFERILRGSVADAVLRRAEVPVILVPRASSVLWQEHPFRLLLALDGSERSAVSLPIATALARGLGARVHVLRAVGFENEFEVDLLFRDRTDEARSYVEEVSRQLTAEGVPSTFEAREGRPVATILRVASERGSDLIIMASHGRGAAERAFFGSVTDSVLHATHVPVLVVPATVARGHTQTESDSEIVRERPPGRGAAA
jgi:nucleotide-binding universal stress UspA family protein